MNQLADFPGDVALRCEANPIIATEDIPFTCNTVFNGSPVRLDGIYYMLLRVEGQHGHSVFALGRSHNGEDWEIADRPVLAPAAEGPFAPYESGGIEDPRITVLEGDLYLTYTAYSGHGPVMGLARTEDLRQFERIALISEPGNKDGLLFPEKINGRYARLDRPIGDNVPRIWISYSDDLLHWGDSTHVLSPRPGYWDFHRVGGSAVPIKTRAGWLEIYHGVKVTSGGPIYRAGVALLDSQDPSVVLGRSSVPILSPRARYERLGDINNVVFVSGAIVEPDGEVKIYYGAADTAVCLARVRLKDLLDLVLREG